MGATLHDSADRALVLTSPVQLRRTPVDPALLVRPQRRPRRTQPALHVLQAQQLHHSDQSRDAQHPTQVSHLLGRG